MLFSKLSARPEPTIPVLHKRGIVYRVHSEDRNELHRHLQLESYNGVSNSDKQEEIPLANVFTWRNLSYAAVVNGRQRVVLDSVSGYLAPRQMCALMGECGVGKVRLALLTYLHHC